jgi:hypothetical protein
MLGQVFQRFVQRSPISVMVRGTLERVLGAEQLNQLAAPGKFEAKRFCSDQRVIT